MNELLRNVYDALNNPELQSKLAADGYVIDWESVRRDLGAIEQVPQNPVSNPKTAWGAI